MPRIDDYMLTAAELRLRARKRRRIVISAITAIVVLVAIVFCARPAANRIKAWQARRHADKGMQLLEQEKWSDARAEVTAAYQLRSTEPEAIRAVARFLSRTRQPQALEFWDKLAQVTQLTRADLRDEASIALLATDETHADTAVKALLAAQPAAADQLLAAQLAIRRNAPDAAHDAIAKVANDPRATAREKLQASVLQLAIAGDRADWRTDAFAALKQLASGNDSAALDALTVLAQTITSGGASAAGPLVSAELARALEAHPLARAQHKLLAKDLEIRDTPEKRNELISAAVEQWKNAADSADLTALAAWLNSKGEFQRTLDAISLDRALQTRELFLQYVDALGGLGRWSEIKQLLESERFPLDPVVQKMYLARCNAQLGETAAADNNWQRALELAGGDLAKLAALAGYAEKNGALDIARAAYDRAAAAAPNFRVAQQGRLRIAQVQRDTRRIHDILATMREQWPTDTAIENDEAYMRLLLLDTNGSAGDQKNQDEELRSIATVAEGLVKKEPASMPHRTLRALALLSQRAAVDALHVYDNINVPPSALSPSALAVHAAVLAANGKLDDAKTEAAQVPVDALLPEERALIHNLL